MFNFFNTIVRSIEFCLEKREGGNRRGGSRGNDPAARGR